VQSRENAGRDLRNHVLPRFGPLRIDALREPDMLAWLASREEEGALPPGTSGRLGPLLSRVWATAAELARGPQPARRGRVECPLGEDDVLRLLRSAASSYNRQLPFILALVMTTGARLGETLNAQWRQFDLAAGVWRIDDPARGDVRELRLSRAAVAVLGELPREESAYLVPNPITRKPYCSIARSWEVARGAAGLPYLEMDELRHLDFGTDAWEELLLGILRAETGGPEAQQAVPQAGPARP
jgi:integrase